MKKVKEHLKQYGQTTSIKGISRIIKSQHSALKILWLIALLFGASIAIYGLVSLVSSYLKYETITQISHCSDCRLEFPDVTLCNLNPLSLMSQFKEDFLQHYDYLEAIYNFVEMQYKKFGHLGNESSITKEKFLDLYNNYSAFYSMSAYFQNVNETKLLEKLGDSDVNGSLVNFCQWWDYNFYQDNFMQCYFAIAVQSCKSTH